MRMPKGSLRRPQADQSRSSAQAAPPTAGIRRSAQNLAAKEARQLIDPAKRPSGLGSPRGNAMYKDLRGHRTA